jgi:DNA-binding IclR family transcriptional regulator
MVARLGQRSPVHATASGQILASEMNEEVLRAIVARTGLKRYTQRTITSMAKFKERLKEVRKAGFVVADAEYKPDLCVISVPIRDHHSKIVAALMTALPSERIRRTRGLSGEIIDILKKEGSVISREIGYQEIQA